METSELIAEIDAFIREVYLAKLAENISKGNNFIVINFADVISNNQTIANEILDNPDETIKAFEIAIEDIIEKKAFARFINLPKTQQINIREKRAKDIGKFIYIEGVIRQKSEVRPKVILIKFECPVCGNTITRMQVDDEIREPSSCQCGRKGRFTMMSQELVDCQRLKIEEDLMHTEGEQAQRIDAFLIHDLVSPISEKRNQTGSRVKVYGVLKEVPILTKKGTKSTIYSWEIEVNYVEQLESKFTDMSITNEDKKQIQEEIASNPKFFEKLKNSIAPSIYGYDEIKEALCLFMVGGDKKTREDGSIRRGSIHICLIGEAGTGKTSFIKRVCLLSPKSRFVSGKGATGTGLTAAVVKDEFIKGWSLEAGALVLASGGITGIDEIDKMDKETMGYLNEAIESQSISISKANIQAVLPCETSVILGGNPKNGRFDDNSLAIEQIEIPTPLLSRFDLVFLIRDRPDKQRDSEIVNFIVNSDYGVVSIDTYPLGFIRKYIVIAKGIKIEAINSSAKKKVYDYYLQLRSYTGKGVSITARQLEGIYRLAEASAKLRLSSIIEEYDVDKAIRILDFSMNEIAFDPSINRINVDIIRTGMTQSDTQTSIDILSFLSSVDIASFEEIQEDLKTKTYDVDGQKLDRLLEKLKTKGELFEPKPNRYKKI